MQPKPSQPSGPWRLIKRIYEVLFCSLLAVNIGLAVFDFTYLFNIPYVNLTMRDVYIKLTENYKWASFLKHRDSENSTLKKRDRAVIFYDDVKGIKNHLVTVTYLEKFDALKEALKTEGRELTEPTQKLLGELVADAEKMINKRPPLTDFSIAEKDGTFELVKIRMKAHFVAKSNIEKTSSKGAFEKFFSAENLNPTDRAREIAFFENQIRPLFEQNYFRWIGTDGKLKDFYLNRIDIWFIFFFWFDFAMRWILAIFGGTYRKWHTFAIRHWYEIPNLLIPYHFAWVRLLRVVPLYFRLMENGWVAKGNLSSEIVHDNAGTIANEITGMVTINMLGIVQSLLQSRDPAQLSQAISDSAALKELQKLIESQVEIVSQEMVPAIEPAISDITVYSINEAMKPWLNSIIGLPLKYAVNQVNNHVRDGLRAALNSPEGLRQMRKIMKQSVDRLISELISPASIGSTQEQLVTLLEEVKQEIDKVNRENR